MKGIPIVKIGCFVLWRKIYIPIKMPIDPPPKAIEKSVRSETRQFPNRACALSHPISINPVKLIHNKNQIIKNNIVITVKTF